MDRKLIFLISVALLAIICIGIGYFITEIEPLWVIGGLLLVLILPGFSLSLAIFPGDKLGDLERLAYTFGLSLIIVALGGLILHWTRLGLNPITWLGFLGITTLLAIIVAVIRSTSNTIIHPWKGRRSIGIRQIIFLSFAVLITIIAYSVARISASQQQSPGFTQLWILPNDSIAPNTIRLGVNSMEPSDIKFKLLLKTDKGMVFASYLIELKPGEKWEIIVQIPTQPPGIESIEADLFRMDEPDAIYRMVKLGQD